MSYNGAIGRQPSDERVVDFARGRHHPWRHWQRFYDYWPTGRFGHVYIPKHAHRSTWPLCVEYRHAGRPITIERFP